jgi:hypothetical protein
MGRLDDLKRLKDAAAAQLIDEGLASNVSKAAGDLVVGASAVVAGAEAVAERSGLTKRNGQISKFKVAKAALRPAETAKTLLDAVADEVQARRQTQQNQE